MSVSKRATDTVFAQLQSRESGATYSDLVKLTGYSLPTVKLAISTLNHTGRIAQGHSRPIVFKAVNLVPAAGQTLIVREPMPPLEINPAMIQQMTDSIKAGKKTGDELIDLLFSKVAANGHDKNQNLLVFLVNLSEVIRVRLENDSELSVDDIMGESK